MSEEKKTIELKDEQLEQVSGGVDSSWTQLSGYEYNQYFCNSYSSTYENQNVAFSLPCCQICTHCTKVLNGSDFNHYCTLGKHPNKCKCD